MNLIARILRGRHRRPIPVPLSWADSTHLIDVDEDLLADARRDSVVPRDELSAPGVREILNRGLELVRPDDVIDLRDREVEAAPFDRELLTRVFGDELR